ncbi:leucine-rich repeat-containing protein 17 [Daphnia magna]|uniref:leucine-rich repeat-containing protein 17 n=1 Tax=Daphnia magna TaxID=35525 RepID=UPI001E1BD34C|nr:leucine-rich repeat-containing protein 17 [Daphnia magna]XP_045030077.1 leucine-rich repeat-containing protein 17 [Daphnia magna]XP_045030078.1 leucine-rich repeat-containing protein 17 [Daphnia magna]XP_045030079.1 leucine-rich repeat-containing protein 17 [Daphnia magna]
MQTSTVKDCFDNFDCCHLQIVSLLVWALVCTTEASICPPACQCLSKNAWTCDNINSVADIWRDSGMVVEELTLNHIKDLNSTGDQSFSDHFGIFVSVRRLKIQQSAINSISASFIDSFPIVETVFLEDNQFLCSEHILSLQRWQSKIDGFNKLQCSSPDGMARTKVFKALKSIERAIKECPRPCRCVVRSMDSQYSIPNLFVNCSQSKLKVTPVSLPKSWVIELDLSHNKIEDATPLFNLPVFRNVSVLNLAHNHIHNIQVPNATGHKNHFRLLNLANNKLTQLAYSVVFDTENFSYQPLVMLRNNPWMCDCDSVKMFQSIAMKQLHIIGDFTHLACGGDFEGHLISSPAFVQRLCHVPAVAIITIRCVNILCFIFVGLTLIKTAFDLRSMYAVGIFHYFAHLLLPPRK